MEVIEVNQSCFPVAPLSQTLDLELLVLLLKTDVENLVNLALSIPLQEWLTQTAIDQFEHFTRRHKERVLFARDLAQAVVLDFSFVSSSSQFK